MINQHPRPPISVPVIANRRTKRMERSTPPAHIDTLRLPIPLDSPGLPRTEPLPPTGLPSDYKAYERILAPIPGAVTQVFVKVGDKVKVGDPLLVIEAMKSKNMFRSGHDLQVAAVHVQAGEVVKAGQLLVEFKKSRSGFLKTFGE